MVPEKQFLNIYFAQLHSSLKFQLSYIEFQQYQEIQKLDFQIHWISPQC